MRTIYQERRLDTFHVVLVDRELIGRYSDLAKQPHQRQEEKILSRRCLCPVERSLVRARISISPDISADIRDLAQEIIKHAREDE